MMDNIQDRNGNEDIVILSNEKDTTYHVLPEPENDWSDYAPDKLKNIVSKPLQVKTKGCYLLHISKYIIIFLLTKLT